MKIDLTIQRLITMALMYSKPRCLSRGQSIVIATFARLHVLIHHLAGTWQANAYIFHKKYIYTLRPVIDSSYATAPGFSPFHLVHSKTFQTTDPFEFTMLFLR